MKNKWTSISDKYEASRDGHIRNKKTKRILKEFVGKDGYLRTQFDGKSRLVHRVIASAFIPRDSEREFINHIDGNKQNNNIRNLEWCTRSENQKHAYEHGLRSATGVKNSRSKLSLDDVRYIKENYKARDPEFGAAALSKRFGVARQTICAVSSGQNWSDE